MSEEEQCAAIDRLHANLKKSQTRAVALAAELNSYTDALRAAAGLVFRERIPRVLGRSLSAALTSTLLFFIVSSQLCSNIL